LAYDLRELHRKFQSADFLAPRRRGWTLKAASALTLAGLVLVAAWFLADRFQAALPISVPGAVPKQITTASGWEGEPVISPDGKFLAYVTDASGSMDIWLIDTDGYRPIRVTDHPASDFAPTWFPDGKNLAFVSDRSGTMGTWKISMLGGSASFLVPDARSPALSPDGNRIAFVRPGPSGDDRIMVTPLADPSQATFLTGNEDGLWDHRDPAWSPDGTRICYAAQRNLWIVPSLGGPARPLTTDDEFDLEPAWSFDGRYIYYSSDRQGSSPALWRVSVDGGPSARLTMGTGSESSPSTSADGSRLAYATLLEDYHLVLADLESGDESILKEDCTKFQPAIAPDKSQLVFSSECEGTDFELWVQPLKEGTVLGRPQRLTYQPGDASHPAYSPDGKWVAYYQVLGKSRDLWIVSSAGGLPIQLTDHPAQDIQPSWSPDGSLLAFASEREETSEKGQVGGVSQIWLLPVAKGRRGGSPRRLTGGEVAALVPVFSPDGSEIAFVGQTDSDSDVWIVSVDGKSSPRRITFGAVAGRIRWNPASNHIYVSGYWGTNRVSLNEVSPDTGQVRALVPEVVLGFGAPDPGFDISLDGRLLCHMSQERRGNIWMLEAEVGSY
jgi:Tol biopolymer transport system component